MRDPARYLPFTQLLAEVMNGNSELSIPQREMIAFYVSNLNDCHYCSGSHRAILAALKVDETTITAIESGSLPDTKMNSILVFTAKLTKNPGSVSQDDINNVSSAGWSDQTIEDTISVVSLFSYLNRLVDGFGIIGTPEGFTQGANMIAQHGYGPIAQMIKDKAAA